MSIEQRRFTIARLEHNSDKAAADALDMNIVTVRNWANKKDVNEVVGLLLTDLKQGAITILAEAVSKAAMVKIAGLGHTDPRIRQDVATEVLDRALGKPTQKQEITGKDGTPLNVHVYIPDNGRENT